MTFGVRPWILAALFLTAGVGAVSAQTVVVRKVPGGSPLALQVNTTAAGSAKAEPDGIGTLPLDLQKVTGKAQIDALVFVDTCDTLRRVVIVEQGNLPPAPETGCDRRSVSGLFLIRRVTTLVIDAEGTSPTLLLIQGSFDPRSSRSARVPTSAPVGLIVFGGGGFTSYRDAKNVACGDAPSCDSDSPWGALSGGVTYWITPHIGAEVSYLKPPVLNVTGSGTGFQFENNVETHILNLTGKVGIPAGSFRIYGHGGTNYTQSSLRTNQTMDGVTGRQQFEVETTGWGWQFGGGLEGWMTRRFALYSEFALTTLKGETNEESGGKLDDRLTSIVIGLRFSIGG